MSSFRTREVNLTQMTEMIYINNLKINSRIILISQGIKRISIFLTKYKNENKLKTK